MASSAFDSTAYKVMLRQTFHSAGLDEPVRIALADLGILSVDLFSSSAETSEKLTEDVGQIVGVARTRLISAWRKARSHMTHSDTVKNRLIENPTTVPEIPDAQHHEFRAVFCRRHQDFLVAPHREPHKKFVEKILRPSLFRRRRRHRGLRATVPGCLHFARM